MKEEGAAYLGGVFGKKKTMEAEQIHVELWMMMMMIHTNDGLCEVPATYFSSNSQSDRATDTDAEREREREGVSEINSEGF